MNIKQKVKNILYSEFRHRESEYHGFSGLPEDSFDKVVEKIIQLIEEHEDNIIDGFDCSSWSGQVDRQSGAFTQDEIESSGKWI